MCGIAIFALVPFGVLINIGLSPRFEKSRAFLLPALSCGMLLAWAVLLIIFFGGAESSNFHNLSLDFLTQILFFASLLAFLGGMLVAGSITVGSTLLTREHALAGRAVFLFSFILWVVAVLTIFLALGIWEGG